MKVGDTVCFNLLEDTFGKSRFFKRFVVMSDNDSIEGSIITASKLPPSAFCYRTAYKQGLDKGDFQIYGQGIRHCRMLLTEKVNKSCYKE